MAAHERFPDISQGLEHEDFDQVRLLLFDRKEMDSNPNRRVFQKDTQSKADQAALLARPDEILDLQRRIDEDTRDVLSVAGTRMDTLLRNKEHFLHHKSSSETPAKVPMVQQKRALLSSFLQEPSATGHQWTTFRSGVQCTLCRQRYHTKSLLKELREGLTSPCTHAGPVKKGKKTRFEIIHDLIESQGEPRAGTHHLRLEKAYLRCTLCRGYVLARAGEESFNRFLGEVCHHGPLEAHLWHGHHSHRMTRTGAQIECERCHERARIRNNDS